MCRRVSRRRPESRTKTRCARFSPRCRDSRLQTISPAFGQRDPDARGYYGAYGGRFVPEALVAPVEELERAYFEARADQNFASELADLLHNYVGRATPLYEAKR